MKLLTILKRIADSVRYVLANVRGEMEHELLEVPQQAIDSLARLLLPQIQQFFESSEGNREFDQRKQTQVKIDKG